MADRNAKIARAALAFIKRFCTVCGKSCEQPEPHCYRMTDQYALKDLLALRRAVYEEGKK